MITTPASETVVSTELQPKARMVWVEPEIEALHIEQTQALFGVGPDGGLGAPDCTAS
jgi:hypothetical protein